MGILRSQYGEHHCRVAADVDRVEQHLHGIDFGGVVVRDREMNDGAGPESRCSDRSHAYRHLAGIGLNVALAPALFARNADNAVTLSRVDVRGEAIRARATGTLVAGEAYGAVVPAATLRTRADVHAEAVAAARRVGVTTIVKGLLRDTGYLIGFSLFVEVGFSLPGLGRTLELAVFNADTPVIESVLVFATLVRQIDAKDPGYKN